MNFKIFKSIFILQDDDTEDEVDARKSDGTPFTKSSMYCFYMLCSLDLFLYISWSNL